MPKVVRRKKRKISTDVEKSLKKYLGIARSMDATILYCRNCNEILGEIPESDSEESGWFNPGWNCECGCIPDYDPNIGVLVGPRVAKYLMTIFRFT